MNTTDSKGTETDMKIEIEKALLEELVNELSASQKMTSQFVKTLNDLRAEIQELKTQEPMAEADIEEMINNALERELEEVSERFENGLEALSNRLDEEVQGLKTEIEIQTGVSLLEERWNNTVCKLQTLLKEIK